MSIYRYKGSKVWTMDFSFHGMRIRESTGTRSKTLAGKIEVLDPNWWKLFDDPILTGLEQQVAASNLTVRIATIRLAESRYQRGVTAADQFPGVNGNTSYTREKISNNGVAALLSGCLFWVFSSMVK